MKDKKDLLKIIEEKYKKLSYREIEYDIEDALKIIENEEYEDTDLIIWVNIDNSIDSKFFDTRDEALEYISENNPQTVSIEFTEEIIIEETSSDLVEYIINTDDISKDEKIELSKFLVEKYIIDNKEYYDEEDDEVESIWDIAEQFKNLSDSEIFYKLKDDEELFQEILYSYCFGLETNKNVLTVKPNENFFKEKNICFVNEIYKELLLNFHNSNFKSGNLNEDSIKLICEFLQSDIDVNDEYFKFYFGRYVIDKDNLIKLLILTVITDYYKFIYSNKNEENFLEKKDMEFLRLIQTASRKELIDEFEINNEFAKTVVNDFLAYHEYFKNNDEVEISDQKTLKKIDPFYILNKKIK